MVGSLEDATIPITMVLLHVGGICSFAPKFGQGQVVGYVHCIVRDVADGV